MAKLSSPPRSQSMPECKRRKKKAVIGILAFEVAKVMSKVVHLWTSLSDKQVDKLRQDISNSVGIKKLVSDDHAFILGLIPGELYENMVLVAKYVARLGKNYCSNPSLKGFEHAISDWINNGVDPYGWELSWEMMETKANRMRKFISINANLYDEMKLLLDLEQTLKAITALDGPILLDFQYKVELKRQEVKNLKEVSLWNMTYIYVVIVLAKSLFTIFSRIKHVFGVPQLKAAAETKVSGHHISPSPPIFGKHKLLDAPPETLGAADLALHYANVIIKIEKLVASPILCYNFRFELYNMLPSSMKAELSERLPCIESSTSSLEDLAAESKEAIAGILEWLAPLAHNTTRWQFKGSFQNKASVSRTHVRLVHTLYYANHTRQKQQLRNLLLVCNASGNIKDKSKEDLYQKCLQKKQPPWKPRLSPGLHCSLTGNVEFYYEYIIQVQCYEESPFKYNVSCKS